MISFKIFFQERDIGGMCKTILILHELRSNSFSISFFIRSFGTRSGNTGKNPILEFSFSQLVTDQPEGSGLREDDYLALHKVIDSLEETDREIIRLVYFENLKWKEVALEIKENLSLPTLRKKGERIREKMRKKILEIQDEQERIDGRVHLEINIEITIKSHDRRQFNEKAIQKRRLTN